MKNDNQNRNQNQNQNPKMQSAGQQFHPESKQRDDIRKDAQARPAQTFNKPAPMGKPSDASSHTAAPQKNNQGGAFKQDAFRKNDQGNKGSIR